MESTTSPQEAATLLSNKQIEELCSFNTPTICNAIETFHVRPRLSGVTDTGIRCLFPNRKPIAGYACTAIVETARPPVEPRRVDRRDYWRYLQAAPEPKLLVVEDRSPEPGGAYWGEVNCTMHQSFGCLGLLTNGSVRDLDEVERLGFGLFASGIQVSHGFAHLEDFGRPVTIFGMEVRPGDLVHADKHGATVIPHEIAARVAAAARQVELDEKPMLAACRLSDPIEELDRLISREY